MCIFSENKHVVLGLFLEIPRPLVEALALACRQRMSGLDSERDCENPAELGQGAMFIEFIVYVVVFGCCAKELSLIKLNVLLLLFVKHMSDAPVDDPEDALLKPDETDIVGHVCVHVDNTIAFLHTYFAA